MLDLAAVGRSYSPQQIVEDSGATHTVKCVNEYVKSFVVGRRAFGKVHAAVDRTNGCRRALKEVDLRKLSRSPLGLGQLETEISYLRRIDHPNIIALRDVLHVRETDASYIVTDLADCGSLEALLKSPGALSVPLIRYIFKEVVRGVAHLHAMRVVHQDIKPANILLSRPGRVFITDFGMAHGFDTPAVVFGTPLYQAPEALLMAGDGPPGREDIWALGITLYEMLFGRTPFGGDDVYEIVAQITDLGQTPPAECDPDAWQLIRLMLSVDPQNRPSIDDVAAAAWVAAAPETMDFVGLPQLQWPEEEPGGRIVEEKAIKCGEDYKIELSPRKPQRSHSAAAAIRLPQLVG
jgi:serine/threonine protein kinase